MATILERSLRFCPFTRSTEILCRAFNTLLKYSVQLLPRLHTEHFLSLSQSKMYRSLRSFIQIMTIFPHSNPSKPCSTDSTKNSLNKYAELKNCYLIHGLVVRCTTELSTDKSVFDFQLFEPLTPVM